MITTCTKVIRQYLFIYSEQSRNNDGTRDVISSLSWLCLLCLAQLRRQ